MSKNDKNFKSRTALISVYDKDGIVDFVTQLAGLGFEILASGGTAKALSEAGIEVKDVASLVGGGAILGHRVVTLSREIHAGLLARDIPEDRDELKKLNIPFIDLVCVDLYPLAEEIEKYTTPSRLDRDTPPLQEGSTARDAIIEKTDIGGPTMIRSAAKGRRIVICDPSDRNRVINWLKNGEPNREQIISELVAKAEFVIADYCLASARYHGNGKFDGILGKEIITCKYGENAWQNPAGLFASKDEDELSLGKFEAVAGTAPSYNNWADLDRLLQTITHIAAGFDVNFQKVPKIAVGVKHGNPCGTAVSDNSSEAIKKMLEGDLRAIFGGMVMVNFEIDEKLAEVLLSHRMENNQRRLLDGIFAPSFSQKAIDMLKRKGDKCRFLVNLVLANLSKESLDSHSRFRYVRGGFLKQPNYTFILDFNVVSPFMGSNGADKSADYNEETSEDQKRNLLLAWAIGSTSNSNTVSLVKNQMLIGNGVGQQDRVGGCELAIKRAKDAGHDISNSVAYSDSFFPFTDGPEVLKNAGVGVILATSGSVRDGEVKQFCEKIGITLITMPDTKGRGFFGH